MNIEVITVAAESFSMAGSDWEVRRKPYCLKVCVRLEVACQNSTLLRLTAFKEMVAIRNVFRCPDFLQAIWTDGLDWKFYMLLHSRSQPLVYTSTSSKEKHAMQCTLPTQQMSNAYSCKYMYGLRVFFLFACTVSLMIIRPANSPKMAGRKNFATHWKKSDSTITWCWCLIPRSSISKSCLGVNK